MNYYSIEPEVAGGWGPNIQADRSTHPPIISHLHYQFDGWLGDEILEAFPCYIVTDELAAKLAGLSGFQLAPVEVSFSGQFHDVPPHPTRPKQMPQWQWLKITGHPWKDDFFVGKDFCLVVSERAFNTLKPHMQFAEVSAAEMPPQAT